MILHACCLGVGGDRRFSGVARRGEDNGLRAICAKSLWECFCWEKLIRDGKVQRQGREKKSNAAGVVGGRRSGGIRQWTVTQGLRPISVRPTFDENSNSYLVQYEARV